ncbi:predicted protein [Naegleria gruberi]|uniref:Predicted protein n=1 Tax=Naegleria gruberi TaxID=5762 RepID=D2UZ06_NAEGR|nr:uncharacterized protein NAEGRDRAFT_61769 [Naegleria gruberi]EFC49863.1 predicted protein [Naegleria gruberi]|eukprot:XP_002682607.1 predicted protein [Naegleria gruberi strain NEG-M]
MSSTIESTSSPSTTSETFIQSAEDKSIAEFMIKQATLEQQRLKQNGVDVKLLKVKNVAIIRDETPTTTPNTQQQPSQNKNKNKKKPTRNVINRVEVNTDLDFDIFPQILLSAPVKCIPKPSLNYVNVILIGHGDLTDPAYLCPYTYPADDKENKLQHWAFINNSLKRTDLDIDAFQDV